MNYSPKEAAIILKAQSIVAEKMRTYGTAITSSRLATQYLQLELANKEHEEFHVLFLSNSHKVIATEAMFRGSVDGASVYTREVVKAALKHNANAVVFAHNHPSGTTEPSVADRQITNRLVSALELIDIRVIDHIIIAGSETVSFAERGLL